MYMNIWKYEYIRPNNPQIYDIDISYSLRKYVYIYDSTRQVSRHLIPLRLKHFSVVKAILWLNDKAVSS